MSETALPKDDVLPVLEAPVDPEVLLGRGVHRVLDQGVDALRVGDLVTTRIAGQRRLDGDHIAAVAASAEERHHLRPFDTPVHRDRRAGAHSPVHSRTLASGRRNR